VIGALIADLVHRYGGRVLVVAAVVLIVAAVLGFVSFWGAFALGCLWLVFAVTHALGFDLFENGDES
jgi:hypothetical protein